MNHMLKDSTLLYSIVKRVFQKALMAGQNRPGAAPSARVAREAACSSAGMTLASCRIDATNDLGVSQVAILRR